MKKKLVLENGMEFLGEGFGSNKNQIAEIVFNTSMTGYQEIFSDPSYCDQFVVMSYPLIGNYGMADDDYESESIAIKGMIVREYNDIPSNFRSTKSLGDAMEEKEVSGISEVDTRKIIRIIRDYGSMLAIITDAETSLESALDQIKNYKVPHDQIKKVSTKKIKHIKTKNPKYTVVAIDCGMKKSIITNLTKKGANVIIVPYNTSATDILNLKPNGVFVSNGPGDPIDAKEVIDTIKELKGKLPILGICLGHQIISLAYNASTYKMKFGHRGGNQPVKNLITDSVEITCQNHSYAIDRESLKETGLVLTHANLIDNEPEGIIDTTNKVIGCQYHPESNPGPEDSAYIFDEFFKFMETSKVKI